MVRSDIWFWEVTVSEAPSLTRSKTVLPVALRKRRVESWMWPPAKELVLDAFLRRQGTTYVVKWVQFFISTLVPSSLTWGRMEIRINTWTFFHLNVWSTSNWTILRNFSGMRKLLSLPYQVRNNFKKWNTLTVQVNVWETVGSVSVLPASFDGISWIPILFFTTNFNQCNHHEQVVGELSNLVSLWVIR